LDRLHDRNNWMYKDGSEKWIATDEGMKWIEKYYDIRDD
jgi:predicted transcriptional regulator